MLYDAPLYTIVTEFVSTFMRLAMIPPDFDVDDTSGGIIIPVRVPSLEDVVTE
jgi:hypothetical protein